MSNADWPANRRRSRPVTSVVILASGRNGYSTVMWAGMSCRAEGSWRSRQCRTAGSAAGTGMTMAVGPPGCAGTHVILAPDGKGVPAICPRVEAGHPGRVGGRVPAVANAEVRLRRRHSFNEDADNYQAARPDYPERVYEVLTNRCGLGAGVRVLEIGPGTGQVTCGLAAAGASVVAVELGAALASRLRLETAGQDVTVVEGDFTTVALPGEPFELAVCGTAFHWLDPTVAVPRLAALVRRGGGRRWTPYTSNTCRANDVTRTTCRHRCRSTRGRRS